MSEQEKRKVTCRRCKTVYVGTEPSTTGSDVTIPCCPVCERPGDTVAYDWQPKPKDQPK